MTFEIASDVTTAVASVVGACAMAAAAGESAGLSLAAAEVCVEGIVLGATNTVSDVGTLANGIGYYHNGIPFLVQYTFPTDQSSLIDWANYILFGGVSIQADIK